MQPNNDKAKPAVKVISIIQIALGLIGIIFGIAVITYSVHGLGNAVDIDKIKELQKNCRQTFNTTTKSGWRSFDAGKCDEEKPAKEFSCLGRGGVTCAAGKYCADYGKKCEECPYDLDNGQVYKCNASPLVDSASCNTKCLQAQRIKAEADNVKLSVLMCGQDQDTVGCSADSLSLVIFASIFVGVGTSVSGSIFVIIASIPVLTSGLYGLCKNEALARVSGGFGVGCSAFGCCGALWCMFAAVISNLISGALSDHFKHDPNSENEILCSSECHKSTDEVARVADHVASYYSTITAMLVLLMLLAIIDIIVTSVSCCVWGKKSKDNVTVAPVTGVMVKGEVIETTATVV